jgi:hypothetical protein
MNKYGTSSYPISVIENHNQIIPPILINSKRHILMPVVADMKKHTYVVHVRMHNVCDDYKLPKH